MLRFFPIRFAKLPLLKESTLNLKKYVRSFRPGKHQKFTQSTEDENMEVEEVIPVGPTPEELAQSNKDLTNFLVRIYRTTGLSIFSSLGLGQILSYTYLPLYHPLGLLFGGLAISLTGIYNFTKILPNIKTTIVQGKTIEKWENPQSRVMAFTAIIAGSGISVSPLLASVANPVAIPTAMAVSIMILGGASLYALKRPIGHFKTWQSSLVSGLFGLLGMNLISIMTQMIIGPNLFSFMWTNVETYLGIALFTAFQAYDTNRAVREFQHGNYDHLDHVVQFFLNFKNLFVRLLQLLDRNRQ